MTSKLVWTLGLTSVLVLGACGKVGQLERPTPLARHAIQPSASEVANRTAAQRARADAAAANTRPIPILSIDELRTAEGKALPVGGKPRGAPALDSPKAGEVQTLENSPNQTQATSSDQDPARTGAATTPQ